MEKEKFMILWRMGVEAMFKWEMDLHHVGRNIRNTMDREFDFFDALSSVLLGKFKGNILKAWYEFHVQNWTRQMRIMKLKW